MRYAGRVPRKQAREETKTERADREARDRLEHADMELFDRFMKKLISSSEPKSSKTKSKNQPKKVS
jgi:hypothetical protein